MNRADRCLLLATDRADSSRQIAEMLCEVGEVMTIATSDIPVTPGASISGIVVDIDLKSAESVQRVRSRLLGKGYQAVPRLFVLADALHHGTMQAWALGATDTIARPFDARGLQHRIRAAFPDTTTDEATASGRALSKGVTAAHTVMSKIFDRLPLGIPLTLNDVMQAELAIMKAVKRSSLRDWLGMVGKHHHSSYRHSLFVTGFAVAFAQHLGMREDDQRRLTRGALLHDVGKAFTPLEILAKPGKLTPQELIEMRKHPIVGYEKLREQGGFPPETLDVVLHHHECLDGTGYPHGLKGNEISDIVRIVTIVDIHAALVEKRAYRVAFTHAASFAMMEDMGDKLDRALLQAFRPVALGM